MKKTRFIIILYSVLAGIGVWLVDETLDYFLYYKDSLGYLDLLLFNVPPQEAYMRWIVIVAFLIYGIIISNYVASFKKMKDKAGSLAKFPVENPNPVLRISREGKVLYSNPAGRIVLRKWKSSNGESVPPKWVKLIKQAFGRKNAESEEIEVGNKTYLVTIVPVLGEGYANLYGIDITARKKVLQKLKDNRRHLIKAQRIAKIGSWEWNSLTDELYWSDEVYNIFGVSPEKFTPGFEKHMEFIPGKGRKQYRETVEKALKKKGPFEYGFELMAGDNTKKYVWVQGDVKMDDRGSPVGLWGTVQDITEKKKVEKELEKHKHHLEELVDQKTRQLKAANKELEAFSFSVSHDLRAPLRSMEGFSQILLSKYSDKINSEVRDYLNRIRNSSRQMSQLIDDLLQLARITRKEVKKEKVNLSKLAKEEISRIRQQDKRRKADISIQEQVFAFGDRTLIRIALYNLLDNAWKFTGPRETACIEFGSSDGGQDEIYFVKDNGVGFDEKYKGKLFGAFQRLHSESEFPGTGIGLATVQRIIHKHEGEIWAESKLGKGATFYFTIPKD